MQVQTLPKSVYMMMIIVLHDKEGHGGTDRPSIPPWCVWRETFIYDLHP